MERKPMTCTHIAYGHLTARMNSRSEKVKVRRKYLNEVIDCHVQSGARPPRALVSNEEPVVDRKLLFNFVVDHGEICGKKVDNDWLASRFRRQQRTDARAAAKERD